MITVVDYGRGNLFSLSQALRHLGFDFHVTSKAADIRSAKRIIFPGVGAFGDAMDGLKERNLVAPLRDAAKAGTPILGICVGCQLLLTKGEEFGEHDGLDLIPGVVTRLPDPVANDPQAIRIPNVGWRSLNFGSQPAFSNAENKMVYFVHSYAPMVANPEHVLATIAVNGRDIPVAIRLGNVTGVQFHPEKSGPAGLALLKLFLETEMGS